MITDKEKIKEMEFLFEFVKPKELKMTIVYLFLSYAINEPVLDEKEVKKTGEQIYFLLKFLSKFE